MCCYVMPCHVMPRKEEATIEGKKTWNIIQLKCSRFDEIKKKLVQYQQYLYSRVGTYTGPHKCVQYTSKIAIDERLVLEDQECSVGKKAG